MSSEKPSGQGSESDSQSEKNGIHVQAPRVVLDNAELVTARGNIVTKDGVVVSTEDSDTSLSTNVFKDPEVRDYYVGVYEKAQYECRHIFDADLTWTKEEEKKIVRKLDWRGTLDCPMNLGNDTNARPLVCTWACVMFFSLQIDRGNINQAVSGTFLKDLKINTNGEFDPSYSQCVAHICIDFNLGNTVFLTSFLLAELPSQLISKKVGPDRWIPTQMVLWSIVAMSQAAIKTRGQFLATRSLLGILEVCDQISF